MCYGEMRGMGMRWFLLLFGEVVFLGHWVTAFDFRRLCTGVTPPPAPLERGDLDAAFF